MNTKLVFALFFTFITLLLVGLSGSDPSPPVITIFNPANTTYSNNTKDINWTSNMFLNWSAFSVNGGANQSFTTEWQYTDFNFATEFPTSLWGDEVSWDGQYVWAVEEDSNYIKKFYVNGTGISQFNTIVGVSEYTRGVTQDETYIWSINTNDKVYQYLMNGTPTGFNFSIAVTSDAFDLDTDGSYIYISDQFPRKVWIYYMNGTLFTSWIPTILDTYSGGITKWGDYIYISNNYQLSDKLIFKFYAFNGTYTGQNFTYTTDVLKTIDTNGIYFWGASDVGKKMYKFYFSQFQQANKSGYVFPEGNNNITICGNSSGEIGCSTQFFTIVSPPTITFINQTPADIDTFNVFGKLFNVTYNISSFSLKNVTFFFTVNNSASGTIFYINGSSINAGNGILKSPNLTINVSDIWTFGLNDYRVYPSQYNFNESYMENNLHKSTTLNSSSDMVKIKMVLTSGTLRPYFFVELMANNSGTMSGRMYYCNATYSTGDVLTSPLCTNIFNIPSPSVYNHTHTTYSSHIIFPVSMNNSGFPQTINNVRYSGIGYYILRGDNGVNNKWQYYYITNLTNSNQIQTSTNTGTTWSNFAGTVDFNIHTYSGDEALYYWVQACDTSETCVTTPIRNDSINLGGISPMPPIINSPNVGFYHNNVYINYTESFSPNNYSITSYNIMLLNGTDETFISTIEANNSPNLSYLWNTSTIADGFYMVGIEACNNNSMCSFGLSNNFTIENTKPTISDINITPSFFVSPIESSTETVIANMTIEETNYGNTKCLLYNQTGNNLMSTNSTPYEVTINTTSKQVECAFIMQYYFSANNYTINVNSTDGFGNSGTRNTTFEYLTLDAFNLSTVALSYNLNPNTSSTNNFNVTNTGNYASVTQIKGDNLTNSSYSIDVSELAWGLNPSPSNTMTTSFASIGTLQTLGYQQVYISLFVPFGTLPLSYNGLIYLQTI